MRTIGVVTTSRSDYSYSLPIFRKIQADPELGLRLFVSGSHLSPEFGLTVRDIEVDGFEIAERVEMLLSSDTPEGLAKSMGLGLIGFAQALARSRPDILLVLGDRFEMAAAALAALPFKIPVGHIGGGDITLGAIDEALRHSMTKLAHLHFVLTQDCGRRVVQLGEAPWRVTICGAPSLDGLATIRLLGPQDLAASFGLHLDEPPLVVTFHPVTLQFERAERQIGQLLAALEESGRPVVFTRSNQDTAGRAVAGLIEDYVKGRDSAQLVDSLGSQGYFSLLALAAAMVGNSSSGLIEAPQFKLPVVNVGFRQAGRLRAANVIDVGEDKAEILAGIRRALDPSFREGLAGLKNPYGDGRAAERIVRRLKSVALDDTLMVKTFHDLDLANPFGAD